MNGMARVVYEYLREIPFGKVVTYGQIAEHLGNRNLARVVGNILHANPDGDRYPCYKVVNSAGELSHNYAFGGLEEQKRRLEAEGIRVTDGRVDLLKYGYRPWRREAMEYRKLPRGEERISVLGLGLGGIGQTPADEIEAIIRKAIANGINFFDMCTAGATYAPFGRAIAGQRDKVYLQCHFGAVYDENGEYGWCRDFETIQKTFLWELETLGTDYVDFGFLHCVDEDADFDKLVEIGVLDYIKELKEKGIVRHIGFSSHTPSVANRILDTGLMDMMMFSINPAYDFEKGDEYGIGSVSERFALFQRCQKEGVGISVMKPFFAGQLLTAEHSPFGVALSHTQCLQYAIDRPGVLVAVPGVQTMEHLDQLLKFLDATEEEKDYSVIGSFTADTIAGTCVYCNHCQPCPAGIDIGLTNKYYDLALAGDAIAANHYDKLSVKADACLACGHCESRCPFGVRQMARMAEIHQYFSEK